MSDLFDFGSMMGTVLIVIGILYGYNAVMLGIIARKCGRQDGWKGWIHFHHPFRLSGERALAVCTQKFIHANGDNVARARPHE